MKAKLLLLVCLLVVGLVSAAIHMPASMMVRWASLPSNVALQGVSGTLWQGKIENIRVDSIDFGKAVWQVSPNRLLKGQLAAQLRFGENSSIQMRGKGRVVLSPFSQSLEQVSIQLPAAELSPFISSPVPIDLVGDIDLFVEEYQYDGDLFCSELKGKANWHNAMLIIMSTPLHIDTASVTLGCDSNHLIGESEQQSAQVSSQFNVNLEAPNRFSLSGWFTPNSDFPEEFASQLGWIGEPDANNRYQIQQSGRW